MDRQLGGQYAHCFNLSVQNKLWLLWQLEVTIDLK